jgi:replication factor C small subunit
MWVETVRPQEKNELVGQPIFSEDLEQWNTVLDAPRAIILAGPSGTGKTSAAYMIAKTLLGDAYNPHNFTVSNGSDERGIDYIRNDLKTLMRVKGIDCDRKIVLIDEADGLTPAAQDAARQIIENYAGNALVILTVNELHKIRPAIKSRCTIYNFVPINEVDGARRLWDILSNVGIEEEVREAWTPHLKLLLIEMDGDMRGCINLLESLPQTKDALENRLITIQENKFEDSAELILNDEFMKMRSNLSKQVFQGIPLKTIMRKLYYEINRQFSKSDSEKEKLFDAMVAYGKIMENIYEWPMGDQAFCDYMVASIRKEMNKNR